MGKLQFVNDNKLGSHAVMVPSSGHVELDMPGRRVRVFPHEGITEGLRFAYVAYGTPRRSLQPPFKTK